jgi:hypothetical protein
MPDKKKLYSASNDKQELKNIANKKHKDSKLQDLEAELTVEGNPNITADSIIEVEGVAGVHSGKWYIEKVTHNIVKSGFTTTMKLNKNATNQAVKNTSQAKDNIQEQQQKQNFGETQNTDDAKTVQVRSESAGTTKKIQNYDADGNPI